MIKISYICVLPCGKECPDAAYACPLLPAGHQRRRLTDTKRARSIAVFLSKAYRVADAYIVEQLLCQRAVRTGLCDEESDLLAGLRRAYLAVRLLRRDAAVCQLRCSHTFVLRSLNSCAFPSFQFCTGR